MKTQDKIKYSIRFNNLTDNQRKSLSLLLHTRIEDITNQNNKKETNNMLAKIKNIDDPEKHLEELGIIYRKSQSFLEPKTPVKEALFRLFVYNNNKPLTVKQISKQLSELWEMSQFPRDIGEEKLTNLLKNVSDYYIQPYGRKFYIKKY
jgi:DNA-binding TFAR19-related protein (PDSD5 family)|tara:strand:- start:54 stop:500 length:447 start_codon:yes stop_codon:yes gene_type:complete